MSEIFQLSRRGFLTLAGSVPLGGLLTMPAFAEIGTHSHLARLEKESGGRIGLFALDLTKKMKIAYRADERFPMCSSFKFMVAAAALKKSMNEAGYLQKRVIYSRSDFVGHSPVTRKNLATGMTVAELCAAAVTESDNAAANLLMRDLGGPQGVTAFARSIGYTAFRVDRWETELNEARPGDERDTTTPAAMAGSLNRVLYGTDLGSGERKMLLDWMFASTTGVKRIRAGIPDDWRIAGKTGTGGYGATVDVGVAFPPDGRPVFMAIFYTTDRKDAPMREDVIARAARLASQDVEGAIR